MSIFKKKNTYPNTNEDGGPGTHTKLRIAEGHSSIYSFSVMPSFASL